MNIPGKEWLVVAAIAAVAFFLIYKSVLILKKKSQIFTYYPFDMFLPGSNTGTFLFYLIFIASTLISLFVMLKNPALFFRPA